MAVPGSPAGLSHAVSALNTTLLNHKIQCTHCQQSQHECFHSECMLSLNRQSQKKTDCRREKGDDRKEGNR